MQVGDLVAHKSNGVLGIIVEEIQSRINMLDDKNIEDGLFSINWLDEIGSTNNHWLHELVKMNL